jgi:hypothetical protein
VATPSVTSALPPLPPGAKKGRRVAQVAFFVVLVWVIVSGSWQILAEGMFATRVPRDADTCRAELSLLRARLADASLVPAEGQGELAAVSAFRTALGGDAGRAWDQRVLELVDGCPAAESSAAYALARLRAAHEAMLRIDVQEAAPAREAHKKALAPLPKGGTYPLGTPVPSP